MKNKKLKSENEDAATSQEKKTIRLSHPRLGNIEVLTEKVLIAKAEAHKVKVLVLIGKEHEWLDRTGSLNEFLSALSNKKFERINKFYVLSWQNYLSYNANSKTIFFNSGFSLRLEHSVKQSVFNKRFS